MSDPDRTQASPDSSNGVSSPTGEVRHAGAQLGEFRLLRRIGKGGMAEVWLAEQTALKRNVALKLLRSDLMEDESYVKRFQTEAKAAAGLNHPNIVQVYTVGNEKGQHYIAQEFVRGKTLKAVLKELGPLELNRALRIIQQVASALQAAGDQGIVHRDIKPENIMLTPKWEVKVADFGLAQLQGGEKLNLTQDGVTMGTPLYMSPEQVSGQKLDQRSDIYSFGVTCYHMLTGTPPFQGENAVSVAVKHLHEAPKPVDSIRKDLPASVCQMVQKMLAKSPAQRYPDAKAVLTDVRAMQKAIRQGDSVDDLVNITTEGPSGFPVRYPALVLTLLCGVVFLLGAARGMVERPQLPAKNPDARNLNMPVKSTAQEQYIQAMFTVDNEDALRAVLTFDAKKESLWIQRAHEQLALLYLKDKRRATDAREELQALEQMDMGQHGELMAKAQIGEAYLEAITDNFGATSRILSTSRELFDTHLMPGSSWELLYRDVESMVRRHALAHPEPASDEDPT